jgi:hypothetical protein
MQRGGSVRRSDLLLRTPCSKDRDACLGKSWDRCESVHVSTGTRPGEHQAKKLSRRLSYSAAEYSLACAP